MQLTPEEVEKIANLARLELSTDEKQRYAQQLSAVLSYVEMLGEVDTNDTVETCQVTSLEDVVREDVVGVYDENKRKKLVDLFPGKMGDLLKVKKVFDK